MLRQLHDYRGAELVERCLALVKELDPLHISIVGGEPLVRWRELNEILPALDRQGREVQLVTSAVRPIPRNWSEIRNLHLAVSIDGLQEQHDKRRTPATYARILQNIVGHSVIVHCTVTRQLLAGKDHLRRFTDFWSSRDEVRRIWFSLYTPQEGDVGEERLRPQDRIEVIEELERIREVYPKVHLPKPVLNGYLRPPQSPEQCIFAQVTNCVSADLRSRITPCQFGGQPVCSDCGCMASAGMASIGDYRLAGLVPLRGIFNISRKIGDRVAGLNGRSSPGGVRPNLTPAGAPTEP